VAPSPSDRGRAKAGPAKKESRLIKDLLILIATLLPILVVYLLPPDTSLSQVQKLGTLTACVPSNFPPLATSDAAHPGFDIVLLQEIAKRLDVSLSLNVNPLIGRDFNPRNWGITRAGCQIVAGGIIVTPTTRSFLETLPTGIETGWTVLGKSGAALQKGERIGVYPGFGGLDRVTLSRVLREHGLEIALAPTADALAQGLQDGSFDAGVTESLSARAIVGELPGWVVGWLPDTNGKASLGFGLWKGDLTLKQKIADALSSLEEDGFVRRLEERYGIAPINETATFAK